MMVGRQHASGILDMPEEIQRIIVRLLSCKDVCNATLACKMFYAWGSALSSVAAKSLIPYQSSMASLLRFQA